MRKGSSMTMPATPRDPPPCASSSLTLRSSTKRGPRSRQTQRPFPKPCWVSPRYPQASGRAAGGVHQESQQAPCACSQARRAQRIINRLRVACPRLLLAKLLQPTFVLPGRLVWTAGGDSGGRDAMRAPR